MIDNNTLIKQGAKKVNSTSYRSPYVLQQFLNLSYHYPSEICVEITLSHKSGNESF